LISPVRDVRNRKRLPIWELDVQDSRRIHSQSCVSPSSESSPMAPQSIYCAPKPVGAVAKYLPKQEIFSKILQRVAIQSSSYKEGLAPDRESAWQNGGIKQESINTNSLNCALSNSIEAFPVPVIPQLSAGQVSETRAREVSETRQREAPSNTGLSCLVAAPIGIRDTLKKSQQNCSTDELLKEQGCTQQ